MIPLFSVITIAVVLNIGATWYLLRVPGLTREQRAAQCALIWLVPVIGAAIVYLVNRELARQAERTSTFPKSQISKNEAIDHVLARGGPSDSLSNS